jgi:hypothetical protein
MIKITNMPTELREKLVLVNDKGEDELIIFFNSKNEITITDDLDSENMYAFWYSLNKEDWQDVKKFIDEQFN